MKSLRAAVLLRKADRKGFTLLELIAVVVILGVLAALAVPTFEAIQSRTKHRVTVTEALALAREGMDIALLNNRQFIVTADFGDNDFNRFQSSLQNATGESPWPYTSKHDITVYIWDNGNVTSDQAGTDVLARVHGGLVNDGASSPTATPTATPSPTATTQNLSINSADGNTTLSGLGTFVDSYNGVTITRTATGVKMTFSPANWEYIETTHTAIDTVYKTSGSNVVGVNTKNSNSDVDITLGQGETFTIRVKYNGGSSGFMYSFTAAG